MDGIKKWVGVAAAVLSASSAIYGALKFQAEKSEQVRIVTARLGAGHLQQEAKDYDGAWASLQQAAKAAHGDGRLVSLLGGLSNQQQQVQTAQEDLAMEWLRKDVIPEYDKDYSEICDKVLDFLSGAAADATGARKADLLAHIGWGHFGKILSTTPKLASDSRSYLNIDVALGFYREAVAADPTNPYANVFWGSSVLQGPWGNEEVQVADAEKHFAAALSTQRVRATVRNFQLAAQGRFYRSNNDWWQAIYQMLKGKEPLDPYKAAILNRYTSNLESEDKLPLRDQLKSALDALPAAEHVELLRWALQGTDPNSWVGVSLQVALALALYDTGKHAESLAQWRQVQLADGRYMSDHPLDPGSPGTDYAHLLSKQVDEQIMRLTAADAEQAR